MSQKVRTHCQYIIHENGVHEFIMLEASRAAVDDFIDAMEEMITILPPGTSAPTLMDSSVGIQPINYIFTRVQNLIKKHRSPAPAQRSKVALIFKANFFVNTVEVMMRSVFPQIKVRIFKPEERETVFKWLTEP